jgi:transposase, IS30 family
LRYDPKIAQQNYQINCLNCGRKCEYLAKSRFIAFVEYFFFNKGWSLDACVGEALATAKFTHDEIVCTKTLYHYVALRLLRIKVSNLTELLIRNTKPKQVRINKRKLGCSIDERSRDILKRLEFGIESVI